MPTTPPGAGPAATGAFARTTITVVMAVIASLAFVFSFGNVWALALRLGVPHPIAPLIAPMVDLSVVGLLVALHHLAAHGTDPTHLRSATRLMHLCGLLTLALNTAEPLLTKHYGRAALDTVAPALLLGWGAVGPVLIRHLHAPPTVEPAEPPQPSARTAVVVPTRRARPPAPTVQPSSAPSATSDRHPPPGKRTGRPPAATMDQLIAIARPVIAESGVTTSAVKQALRDANTPISSARLTELMKHLKDEHAHAAASAPDQPEAARTHPADA